MYFETRIRNPVHCPSCGREAEPREVFGVFMVYALPVVAAVVDCEECGTRFTAGADGQTLDARTTEKVWQAIAPTWDNMEELERTLENPRAAGGLLSKFREAEGRT